MSIAIVLQQSADVVAELDRIGDSTIVLAWAIGTIGLGTVIAIVYSLHTLRAATKLIESVERQLNRLVPRAEPLLDKVTLLADDARDVSDTVRRRVKDLMDTVADVNDSLQRAKREAEKRVREIGAVLEVVQAEAEELMLDAAATARGVHVTAAALRQSRDGRIEPDDVEDDNFLEDEDDDEGEDEEFDDDNQLEVLLEADDA